MKTMMRVTCVMLLTFVLFSSFTFGQDVWQLPLTGSSISLEYLSPSLSNNYFNSKISMYSVIATGNFQLRSKSRIIVEIPYVRYHRDAYEIVGSYYTYPTPEYKSGNIGNLYFAYEFMGKDEHLTMTIGVYLPTGSDKESAPGAGLLFDYERFALYIPNYLTFRPQINYHSETDKLFLNIKGSPTITILTKSDQGVHAVDLFAVLSLQGGMKIGDFSAAIGWAGNFSVTGSGEASDRIIDQAGVMVGYKFGHIQPELFVRFPMSTNLSNILNSVIGVSARYEF